MPKRSPPWVYSNTGLAQVARSGLRFARRLRDLLREAKSRLRGTEIPDSVFYASLTPGSRGSIHNPGFLSGPFVGTFFLAPHRRDEFTAALRHASPAAEELIIHAADTACAHRFDLLGSGTVDLSPRIDWHADFKTGHQWDRGKYYSRIQPAPYPGGYDIKVPWELSRFQHLAWLGQAYWLTEDEKYALEFRAEIEDWIRQNPPEFGVNWASSMDVSIRAVNWLWGYAFFQDSPTLDRHFRIEFHKSLLCHGQHIRANLDRSISFAGNHYLADLVGLAYLGILLQQLIPAGEWRAFALRELEREMFKQVYVDGVNFEASTSYHRLATELFLSATLLAQMNGYDFSAEYMQRLEGMLEVVYHLTRQDGTVPIMGDQDNGRLHRLKVWKDPSREWTDFGPLLATGALFFNRVEWAQAISGQWEEAIWFFGGKASRFIELCANAGSAAARCKGFDVSKLYVMKASDVHIVVDMGEVGQRGRGGHAHNDTLSFELHAAGQCWVQDPGTYVYTLDYAARNAFRSTASHNTIAFRGYEQNSFDPRDLFRVRRETTSKVLSWVCGTGGSAYLAGESQRIIGPEITHGRSFFLDGDEYALVITDQILGASQPAEFTLHFAPETTAQLVSHPYVGIRLSNPAGQSLLIALRAPAGVPFRLSSGWISESYGSRRPGEVATLELPAGASSKVLFLLENGADSLSRIEAILAHEAKFLDEFGQAAHNR